MPEVAGPARPLLRSVLFAPANRPDLLAKLPRARPDVAVMDLEDGTPLPEKERARHVVVETAWTLSSEHPRQRLYLRVNDPDSPLFDEDLDVAVTEGIHGLVVPKTTSAEQVVAIERALAERERAARARPKEILFGIETAAGVEASVAILEASTRAIGAYFGAEDFAADVGARRTAAGTEVLYARSRVVIAARLAGIAAVDQVVTEVRDPERFAEDARAGRDLGYRGKLCVHPDQVALAHAAFAPSAHERDRAARLLAAYEQAMAEGRGTLEFEGAMVDLPLVEQARALVDTEGSRPGTSRQHGG